LTSWRCLLHGAGLRDRSLGVRRRPLCELGFDRSSFIGGFRLEQPIGGRCLALKVKAQNQIVAYRRAAGGELRRLTEGKFGGTERAELQQGIAVIVEKFRVGRRQRSGLAKLI